MVLCECGLHIQEQSLAQHLGGKRHRVQLQMHRVSARVPQAPVQPKVASAAVRCDICGIALDNMQAYDAHSQGANHQRVLAELAHTSSRRSAAASHIPCQVCGRNVPFALWDTHVAEDSYHQRRKHFATVTALLQAAELNKNGIVISGEGGCIDFGMVEVDAVYGFSTERILELFMSNEVPGTLISLARISFTSSLRRNAQSTSFSAVLRGASRFINHSRPRSILVTFHPSYVGRFEDTAEFEFHDLHRRERFVIIRRIVAIVGSPDDHELLKPKGPYVRPLFVPRQREPRAISTTRPPTWSKTKWKVPLPENKIPDALANALNTPNTRKSIGEIRRSILPSAFNNETYARYFQPLLHVEEWQQSVELSRYDMVSVPLEYEHPKYRLAVPGLAEGKPSILVGDTIIVQKARDESEPWYEGIVHRVTLNEITLHITSKFSMYKHTSKKVNVKFKLNRMPLRRAHQAVCMPGNISRILFPRTQDMANLHRVGLQHIQEMELVDRTLLDDAEQMETIAAIVNMPPGSVPFILYGPPGTGKTVAIVEAIHQLLKRDPNARILACSPSNKSADLLDQRLADLGPTQMFRLNALSRKVPDLPKNLLDFSLVNGNEIFVIPEAAVLKSYRVLVSTCVSAGVPYGLGISQGWYSHIFVDEAGQLTEPDIMIPIKTMANEHTNVVLAGDIKQLGPVVRSTIARDLGLKTSFLQRLMNMPPYDLGPFRGITVTKLLKHWRSHPAIINFSNKEFYENELQPCGDTAITHSMLRSDDLVNPKFPIVFHAILGKDEQEEGSPSYFNIEEASLVKKYCEQLLNDRKMRLRAKDLGVISPYSGQCGKIRNLLGRLGRLTEEVKVGSVEEFQGQERRVIIISTVRSRKANVIHDLKHELGFVGDARRFNVAITRARALLIVIGDPSVLSLDPIWREFLSFVRSNGGWRGKKMDWDASVSSEDYAAGVREQSHRETQELIERIKSLIVDKDIAEGWEVPDPDEDGEAYMDRPVIRDF